MSSWSLARLSSRQEACETRLFVAAPAEVLKRRVSRKSFSLEVEPAFASVPTNVKAYTYAPSDHTLLDTLCCLQLSLPRPGAATSPDCQHCQLNQLAYKHHSVLCTAALAGREPWKQNTQSLHCPLGKRGFTSSLELCCVFTLAAVSCSCLLWLHLLHVYFGCCLLSLVLVYCGCIWTPQAQRHKTFTRDCVHIQLRAQALVSLDTVSSAILTILGLCFCTYFEHFITNQYTQNIQY